MPRQAARWLVLSAANRLISCSSGPDGWRNNGIGGTTFGGEGEFATPIEDVARNLDRLGDEMAERAARYLVAQGWTNGGNPIHDGGRFGGEIIVSKTGTHWPLTLTKMAHRVDHYGGATMGPHKYDLAISLCAGTASEWWDFPVSRQGSKRGYRWALWGALGIDSPPPRLLLVEPDVELARTLALLCTPGGAAAVAEVIRSWIPCPAGHTAGGAEWCLECATWMNHPSETNAPSALYSDKSTALSVEARIERKRDGTIRRWASGPSTGKQDARRLWERLRRERPEESPEREAGLLMLQRCSNSSLPIVWVEQHGHYDNTKRRGFAGADDGKATVSEEGAARRLDNLAPLPATVICGRAEDVEVPPGDLGRVLCFLDPPYSGTTGYAHLFPREAVVAVARRWADAGAHVVISEAEPIPELIADGWHFVDIADARIGQRRTFSKQQREVLTSNRPLRARHAWPARDALRGQFSLFGAT